jgi:hypothetical protein
MMMRQWGPALTGAGDRSAQTTAMPEITVRLVGALLAFAVASVHVADQGGITSLGSPDWLGWAFRLVEAGGVITAFTLLLRRTAWLGWSAGLLLGLGPFLGYLTTRSIGLPGDAGDVGNWGYWTGTVSLIIEAALVVLSATTLRAGRRRARPPDSPSVRPRLTGIR